MTVLNRCCCAILLCILTCAVLASCLRQEGSVQGRSATTGGSCLADNGPADGVGHCEIPAAGGP